jgi:ribose 5-phosphate isomerase A
MMDELKRQASIAALDAVKDGMIVGLGSGSTAAHFIRELGNRVQRGLRVQAIPSSEDSRRLAEEVGIPLTTLHDHPVIDVTVDGADEVSDNLDLLKGRGGALVREKVVAHASKYVIIIVDESKLTGSLGVKFAIPVEVVPFAVDVVKGHLIALGGESSVRESGGKPFISDNGNLVLDWSHGRVDQPAALEKQLKAITGVVDSGIFTNVAGLVIAATSSGIRKIHKPE